MNRTLPMIRDSRDRLLNRFVAGATGSDRRPNTALQRFLDSAGKGKFSWMPNAK